MAEVTIELNSKKYNIACDDGQEARVAELAQYINERLVQIAGPNSGHARTDSHLLVLTSLVLADEIYDLKERVSGMPAQPQQGATMNEEETRLIAQAVDHLRARVEKLTQDMRHAA